MSKKRESIRQNISKKPILLTDSADVMGIEPSSFPFKRKRTLPTVSPCAMGAVTDSGREIAVSTLPISPFGKTQQKAPYPMRHSL